MTKKLLLKFIYETLDFSEYPIQASVIQSVEY